ncbi:hypothetical protein Tco_1153710 [Tanacetum coccineum]
MANLSEDIQCAGSDTRPPMLDKADFASWQQRIRLYCRGKENGVNILKSIDEGPFQMGTTRGIVAEGTECPINLGPERPRLFLYGIYHRMRRIGHMGQCEDAFGRSELTKKTLKSQLTSTDPKEQLQYKTAGVVQNSPGRGKSTTATGYGHIAWNCTQPKRPQHSNTSKNKIVADASSREWVVLMKVNNDLHESDVLSVSHTPRNTVANNLLNAKLATYKEQVELYERRARFELTEREQKIDEQLRIVICDRNFQKEFEKGTIHSLKIADMPLHPT